MGDSHLSRYGETVNFFLNPSSSYQRYIGEMMSTTSSLNDSWTQIPTNGHAMRVRARSFVFNELLNLFVCVIVFAFSAGPRACIGQRFAMAESICILSSVVRRYEILLPMDVLGLSLNEQKEILTGWRVLATMTPTNARVRFRKRLF